MRAVGLDEPFFVARGDGAYLETADGRTLLDWVQSWGPLIFGHADAETVEAVREAALDGTSFGAPTEREVELAAEIVDAVPSVEQVRLVSSGTEAAMSAIRLARAFTRRDRVIKFDGGYHGHADAFLASAGSGLATLGIPSSPGVPSRRDRRHDRRRLQRRRRAPRPRSSATAKGSPRSSSSRSPGTWAASRPRRASSRALRMLCDATRRAARLRRGDHRLPGRARRRAGALRRAARPDDPRQDRRRRAAARRLRRARRGDVAARAGGRRLPGRDALREPARDRGRASRCCAGCATSRSTRSSSGAAHGSRPGLAPLRPRAARRRDAHVLRRRGARDARSASSTRPATPSSSAHLLERGIYVAPSQYECMFPSLAHGDEEIDATIEAVR